MNALRTLFTRLAFLVSLSLGFVPAFAMAATLGVSSDTSATVEVGVGAGADNGTDASASGSVNSASDASTATGTASDSDSTTVGVSGDATILFNLSQKDALGATVSVTSPAAVGTNADLSAFAVSQLQADANLEAVSATEQSLTVRHAAPARLFGIFPVHLTTTTTVSVDGTVEVKYPWYSFLFTTNRAELEATLASRVESAFSGSAASEATTSAAANASFSAAQKAQVLSEMQQVFADFSAQGSADANANVSS